MAANSKRTIYVGEYSFSILCSFWDKSNISYENNFTIISTCQNYYNFLLFYF